MAKGKTKPTKKEVKNELSMSDTSTRRASGSTNQHFNQYILSQIVNTIWLPENMSEEQQIEAVRSAVAALEGIAPTSEIEGLLAAQMIATHNAAMECLRRAMIEGQTSMGCDQNLKHAAKLLGIYSRQVETLDKHRGKGRQKITVEHVTVHKGGQAIVGNIETTASGISETQPALKTLENDPGPEIQTIDLNSTSKRKTTPKVRSRNGR